MWSTTKVYTFIANTLDTSDCEGKIALGQLCHKSQSIKPKLHFQTGVHSIKEQFQNAIKPSNGHLTFKKWVYPEPLIPGYLQMTNQT